MVSGYQCFSEGCVGGTFCACGKRNTPLVVFAASVSMRDALTELFMVVAVT